jgi:hypothetical protein
VLPSSNVGSDWSRALDSNKLLPESTSPILGSSKIDSKYFSQQEVEDSSATIDAEALWDNS